VTAGWPPRRRICTELGPAPVWFSTSPIRSC